MTRFAFFHRADNISSPCSAVVHDLHCRRLNLLFKRATEERGQSPRLEGARRHAGAPPRNEAPWPIPSPQPHAAPRSATSRLQ